MVKGILFSIIEILCPKQIVKGLNMRKIFYIWNSFRKSYQTKKEAQRLENLVNIARMAY